MRRNIRPTNLDTSSILYSETTTSPTPQQGALSHSPNTNSARSMPLSSPPSTTSLSALHAVRSRRSSLFQTGGSLITQPLKPYSAAHSPAQGPRSISPRRAPPSPRTYQGSEGHTQDLQLYGWALLVFTIMYFSFNFVYDIRQQNAVSNSNWLQSTGLDPG
ncbi:hypothetical protein BASA61_002708 [Batrachochytrium salamandrivorans]|nr:hypothetical protein BASA61_002708 [Batrachochytrium salamandrivorans]